MCRLAVVRGTGQRQFLIAQVQRLGSAAFHQWQRLQHLDGRARKDRPVDVAQRQHATAIGVEHRQRAAMGGLHGIASMGFDQDGVHAVFSSVDVWHRMYFGAP